VDKLATEHEFDVDSDAQESDWYRYSTNLEEDDEPLKINDENQLIVQVEANFYIFVPSED
jgi:hypothetical protein